MRGIHHYASLIAAAEILASSVPSESRPARRPPVQRQTDSNTPEVKAWNAAVEAKRAAKKAKKARNKP